MHEEFSNPNLLINQQYLASLLKYAEVKHQNKYRDLVTKSLRLSTSLRRCKNPYV